jgi:uncharacterized protein YjbI with pentapeptide repeats
LPTCKDSHQWCKDEFENGKKPAYINEAGMEYCVFHAPKEKKGVSLEDFNKRIFDRINHSISEKQFCDLSRTIFEGDISFSSYDKSNPLPEISFSRAKFSGMVNFTDTEFSKKANFSRATFEEANFNNAKFSGKAYFNSTIFNGGANFTGTEFGAETRFNSAQFEMEAVFLRATFSGKADFSFAEFGSSDFYVGEFKGGLTVSALCHVIAQDKYSIVLSSTPNTIDWLNELLKTPKLYEQIDKKKQILSLDGKTKNRIQSLYDASIIISMPLMPDADVLKRLNRCLIEAFYPDETPENQSGKIANFDNAKFSDDANFNNAKFSGMANFYDDTRFSGMANFIWTRFRFNANFTRTEFSAETRFDSAQFEMEAVFTRATFSGEADFSFAKFSGNTNFDSAKFNVGARFYEREKKDKTFKEGAIFSNFYAKEKVRFEGINLEKVSFLDSDLRNVDFINCELQKQGGRDILYDEVLLFCEKGKGIWQKAKRWWSGLKQRDNEKIKNVEILYRRLKQKYTDEHDWPEVSNWHYGEKEMARKQNTWIRIFFYENFFTLEYWPKFFNKFVYDLYWLSSGYAEKPFRAGMVLGIFIVIASVLAKLTGFIPSQKLPVYTITGVSEPLAYLLNTLQYVAFYKEPIFRPASLLGECAALFTRIVIPIQAALFGLAIRNRFRR